jgi:hypothetical protein
MGIVFAFNEGLMLRVAGHFLSAIPTPAIQPEQFDNKNLGHHQIHTGGKYVSCLVIPVVAGNRT